MVEAIPIYDVSNDFESRYDFGRTRFVCPAELLAELTRRAKRTRAATYKTLGCAGVRPASIR